MTLALALALPPDALAALGLSVEQLQGLNPEEQFFMLANALAKVENASERAALAQRIFGRSGTELLPLFAKGAAGMEALRQQARDLGIVMSGEAAAGAADFKDAQNELKAAISGVALQFAGKLVPRLTDFIRLIISKKPQIVAFFTGIKEAAAPFFSAFVLGIQTIWPLARAFAEWLYKNKPILIATMLAIGAVIVTALGPVSLAALAITGIITLIGFLRGDWETAWGAMKGTFQRDTAAIAGFFRKHFGWLAPGGSLIRSLFGLRDTWNEIFDHLKAVIASVANFILPIIDRIVSAIGAVSGAVGKVSGLANRIGGGITSALPGLATGGNVTRSGAALVGERGPELLALPRGAQVSPLGGTGNAGGDTYNIYTLPAADWERAVERIINSPGARARAIGRA